MDRNHVQKNGSGKKIDTSIERCISIIGNGKNKKLYKTGDAFINLNDECHFLYLIESGVVGIYRKNDNLLIQEVEGPLVIGLAYLFHKADIIALAHSEISAYKINREDALLAIDKNSLWQDVATILARVTRSYALRDANIIGLNAYKVVRYHLELLIQLPAEQRLMLNAAKFISDRTFISRSRIMEILKQLNAGSYITIKNGILIRIKHLPFDF
ncbi:helix-turn-helix domain-containing protein [Buttiauxella agrestis]|uniref:helix-turn-helix domain-containing protein n=1 Tax=Buttiauxella agrestis TaxID=82977 RepID=UPI003974E706